MVGGVGGEGQEEAADQRGSKARTRCQGEERRPLEDVRLLICRAPVEYCRCAAVDTRDAPQQRAHCGYEDRTLERIRPDDRADAADAGVCDGQDAAANDGPFDRLSSYDRKGEGGDEQPHARREDSPRGEGDRSGAARLRTEG